MRYILIFTGIVFIVCVYGGVRLFWELAAHSPNISAAPGIVPADAVSVNQDTKRLSLPKHADTQQVDPDAFYQTIIDNNIFRPPNWEPPQREAAYALLGTAITAEGSSAKAYIQEQKSDQFYTVAVGDQVGDATVQKINDKQVTLTNKKGDTLKLHLSGSRFLNPKRTRRTQSERSYESVPQIASAKTIETSQATSPEAKQQRMQEKLRERLKKRAEAIRSERNQMMERLQYLQQR